MSFDIADGFDFAATVNDLQQNFWDIAAQATVGTTHTPFGTGNSLLLTGVGPQIHLQKTMTSNEATRYICFYMYMSNSNNSSGYMSVVLNDGASNQCAVRFREDFSIVLVNSAGTILGTPITNGFTAGAFHHFQISLTINNTNGSLHIRKDGSTTDTYAITGVDTQNTGNAYSNVVQIVSQAGLLNNFTIDDLFMNNSSGSTTNTFPGEIRSIPLMPASDVSVQFSPNTGLTNYTQVRTIPQNNFSSYVQDSTASNSDLYTITALAFTPSAIIGATVRLWGEKTDSGSRSGQAQLKSSTTTVTTPSTACAVSGMWYWKFYDQDPATTTTWTAAGINAVELGPVVAA